LLQATSAERPRVRRRAAAAPAPGAVFPQRALPLGLALPQLIVVAAFFLWPTYLALREAFVNVNAFGLGGRFVGLANFVYVLTTGSYLHALEVTAEFGIIATGASMALGLLLAEQVQQVRRGRAIYRTLFAWMYAVPAAVAGSLWLFIFNPQVGMGGEILSALGVRWDFLLSTSQALAVVISMTVWQQTAYNFLFFTAGLQSLPEEVLEAGALDGAGPSKRFWRITFPMLAPTTFYLSVVNIIFVFFSTFATIDILTQGGPDNGTATLVYKIYLDAFQNSNTSVAGAETILLIVLVSALTALQFRFLGRRGYYQ
jgi:sn-glycerol 3-phosphate transport system permease protein